MAKERKTRNFDFLKESLPELPSREEVIQKTVELTGQSIVPVDATPSVSPTVVRPDSPQEPKKTREKKPKVAKEKPVKAPKTILVEQTKEKGKVGRRALTDTRKPFTSTITVENKKRLRQLCAQYDIAMSDALNEILAAQFEKREPIYKT